MKARRSANRAFEHGFRTPSTRFQSREREDAGRQFYYARLMQVALRHTYYNRSNDECPDFTVYPTRHSQDLMNSLGLIFRDEGTSFSILYDVRRTDILIRYLKRQEWPEGSRHCWTQLSFVLSLNNPYFLNFTEVPIDMNPTNRNFYFSNRAARPQQPGGQILLNPGEHHELLLVIPVQLAVDVTNDIKEIEVQSVPQTDERSDEADICRPRCVPVMLLKDKNLAAITCKEARDCNGQHKPGDSTTSPIPLCSCTNRIYLDFSALPEDKYTIKRIPYASAAPSSHDDEPVLYTASYPMPFCFVSLFFTSPTGERPNLFPVQNLFEPTPKIEPITYDLKFERRSTFWNYFVVPQAGESIENLRIEGEPGISFKGPCTVTLPNRRTAYQFVSRKRLPFMEQSSFRFRLKMTTQNTTLMEYLPVASVQQVLQDELSACLRLSEIIAPGAKGDCRNIQAQTCRGVCGDAPLRACLKRLKRICADPGSSRCQKIRRSCSRVYSDTYVYV